MSWRSKRQLLYIGLLILIGLGVMAMIIVPKITVEPTCYDGKRNGDEQGVDCGGACALYCEGQYNPVVINWARYFPLGNGLYNVVVYGENRNLDAFTLGLNYEINIYDGSNILLKSITGTTHIMPNGEFAILHSNVDLSGKTPKRVVFSELGQTKWYKMDIDRSAIPLVRDRNAQVNDWNGIPSAEATLINESYVDSVPMDVIILLFDKDGNAIQASKTFVDSIASQTSKKIYFSWRNPLSAQPTVIKVLELPNYYQN